MITSKKYILVAIPLILSTITTPLLGMVDTMVIGHLSNASFIGGIAISVMIFNTLYWLFGFLRVSTTGLVAQAFGRNNAYESKLAFFRPLLVAIVIGVVFVLAQQIILSAAYFIMKPEQSVWMFAKQYFSIRIWGAPFALAMYVIVGWLIGASKVKITLFLQLYMNVLNIILCIVFVMVLGWEVKGVALATVIAEISAPILGIFLVRSQQFLADWHKVRKELFDIKMLKVMWAMNRDFFIRTICLLTAHTIFTAIGSSMSVEVLAANTILFQLHFVFAYFFDGLANASSIFMGNAVGAKNEMLYKKTLHLSFWWSFVFALLMSATFYVLGPWMLAKFTNIQEVYQLTLDYYIWLTLFPICGFWALMLGGIFSGATLIKPIRDSHIWSLVSYFIVLVICIPLWSNHGLWLAFIVFNLGRSVFLAMYQYKINHLFRADHP
ncbi:MATE family efflux transporter [Lysinibacillus sp. FSL K6-0232]|uniref:MATE family efflux transporter n=1 Tax=unclassified Lysinibacillus TaxID=2636778 RepID=UPI0030F9F1E8